MEFKGTKGNWIVDEEEFYVNEYNAEVYVISNENRTQINIADIYGSKENAQLISKAPEMLEMLIKLCKLNPTHSLQIAELMDKAEVLIKEATEIH